MVFSRILHRELLCYSSKTCKLRMHSRESLSPTLKFRFQYKDRLESYVSQKLGMKKKESLMLAVFCVVDGVFYVSKPLRELCSTPLSLSLRSTTSNLETPVSLPFLKQTT